MRISHEAIYQALYVQSRGALKRELVTCLRIGRALRVPRARAKQRAWAHVTSDTLISERPAEVADRAVPGHWEGDLIIGLQRSAIGTLVERTTRFTMLIHLPREDGWGVIPRTKNGPAPAGYGAITMSKALAETITTLPEQLRRSLTWDRGKELSAHARFTVETGVPVFFADPHSPWQRGTNGLLRQYFPKGTDLSRWSAEEINAVAHALNSRPRKTLALLPVVPGVLQYPNAYRAGEPDFLVAATGQLWTNARRAAMNHVLAAIAATTWGQYLVLRGSVTIAAWVGDAAASRATSTSSSPRTPSPATAPTPARCSMTSRPPSEPQRAPACNQTGSPSPPSGRTNALTDAACSSRSAPRRHRTATYRSTSSSANDFLSRQRC